MKKNFYYFKEDAEIAAKEFAAENNTDVLRKASVDVSTNFDFSDEPAKIEGGAARLILRGESLL